MREIETIYTGIRSILCSPNNSAKEPKERTTWVIKREKIIDQGISKSSSGIPLIVVHAFLAHIAMQVSWQNFAAMLWTLSTLIVCFILESRQLLSLAVFIRSNERRRYVEKTRAQTTDYSRLIRKNNAFICLVPAKELWTLPAEDLNWTFSHLMLQRTIEGIEVMNKMFHYESP